jgi:glycosyltransferase involved in cell wall biosynthesis
MPYRIALQSQIDHLKLSKAVHLHGFIDDAELGKRFVEADIVSCLRLPALEGASASCIEAMLYGKAVVVMDTGFYSSIPSDIVIKVPPTEDGQDLRDHLEMLVVDSDKRHLLGRRARDWAEVEYAPDTYVQRIECSFEAAAAERPLVDALRQIARSLQFLHVQPEDPLVGRIGSEIQRLFCGGTLKG